MERRSDELFIVLISLFFCTLMKNLWKLWSIISLPVCIGVSKSHRSPCMQSDGQLGWHVESFDFDCGIQIDGEAASQGSLIISTMYLHNDHPWVSHICELALYVNSPLLIWSARALQNRCASESNTFSESNLAGIDNSIHHQQMPIACRCQYQTNIAALVDM